MPESAESRLPDGVSYQNLHPGLFLDRSARVYPDKPSVIYGDLEYSYRDFDERVSGAAGALTAAGTMSCGNANGPDMSDASARLSEPAQENEHANA